MRASDAILRQPMNAWHCPRALWWAAMAGCYRLLAWSSELVDFLWPLGSQLEAVFEPLYAQATYGSIYNQGPACST